jgi:hypothetical protein
MDAGALLQRVYDGLGPPATVFWTPEEIFLNGLNPAQRLLVLLKPMLLTQRVPVSLVADEVFIDLRVVAPRAMRIQRVALGDVTTEEPVLTQGREGDLRHTTLATLRGQRDWFRLRRGFPTHWYTHGLYWVCPWPRSTQALTMTLVFSAMPTPLEVVVPSQIPDLPVQFHPVIADVAIELLRCKEGAGEIEQAIDGLGKILGDEPFKQLKKTLRAIRYKQQYAAAPTG